jgi:hypothetical protein
MEALAPNASAFGDLHARLTLFKTGPPGFCGVRIAALFLGRRLAPCNCGSLRILGASAENRRLDLDCQPSRMWSIDLQVCGAQRSCTPLPFKRKADRMSAWRTGRRPVFHRRNGSHTIWIVSQVAIQKSKAMKVTKNIGMLLLAVYLIIDGLLGFGINFGPAIFLLYLVALAAGIFILIGK